MKSVFVVQHEYETNGFDHIKFIGVYSNFQNAENAVNQLSKLQGFRDRKEGFCITEYDLNESHWIEGFG